MFCPRIIAHRQKVSVEDLVPRVRHARQAPVAAVFRRVRRRPGLPVPRRVAIPPNLRHVRYVQEPGVPPVAPHASRRARDRRVHPRVLLAELVTAGDRQWLLLGCTRAACVPRAIAAYEDGR